MREILFRGKRPDNGEWFEGYLVCLSGMYFIFSDKKHECHTVIKDTISQFTGMLDKNGKKIFEGDIVRCYVERCVGCYPYSEKVTLPVTYQAGVFTPLFACDHKSIEIVGNIHDTLVMEE